MINFSTSNFFHPVKIHTHFPIIQLHPLSFFYGKNAKYFCHRKLNFKLKKTIEMKTKVILTTSILMLLSVFVNAQKPENKDHIWSYEGRKKNHTIGTYVSISGTYSPLKGDHSYWLGGRIGLVFDKKWTIGVGGNVLDYDKKLTELVTDGEYRLEAAYSGMFLERLFPLKDWGKIGVSWLSGMGVTSYRYDNEYAESRPWYEEIIDTERFAVNELSLEFQLRIYHNWWLGAKAGYRLTSPIKLKGEDDFFLRDYDAGITVKWGVF